MNKDSAARPDGRRRPVNIQALGIVIAAVVIFLGLGLLNPNFLNINNLRDVAVSACVNALIGIGLTFVIVTGGIDLSVGSIASFVGIVSADLMVNAGVSPSQRCWWAWYSASPPE
ncbi:ABC transporter permease [Sinomonas atrocyanea]